MRPRAQAECPAVECRGSARLFRAAAALLSAAALAAGPALAGPNASATLRVDADPRTAAVEPSAVSTGRNFLVAVRIAGAVRLDGFAFELGYDTALVAFVGARSSSPADGIADFLESRGGQAVAFVGRLSARDTSRVTVANALAGADSSRSPSGEGVLAVLEFRAKATGMARFHPGKVELLDWSQELDSAQSFLGASVDIQDPTRLRGPRPRAVLRLRGEGDFPWLDLLGRSAGAKARSSPGVSVSRPAAAR